MAVLVIAEVDGQTEEEYRGLLVVLEPLLRQSKGFIAQGGGPCRDSWRTFEIWESQEDATRFFAAHIHPHLPPGVRPRRTLVELRNLII